MPTSVVRLVSDKKPVLAVAVALGLSLAPVYCALFWKWSGLSDHQGLHLWPVVFPMHVVPAIAYFAVLNLTMRRRVQAWWLVPARPEHIGRALWWLAIGIPAGVLMVGMAVDAAIVEPILRNPGYFDGAAARFVTLSIVIVNWGAWNLLRHGRFRYRNASGPLGGGSDHAKMLWPSVAILLVMLAIFEFHFIGPLSSNVFEPAWTAIGGYMVLVLTGAVFYALPKLPIWLNALMEEEATSNASKKLSAVAPWSWALVCIFGLGLILFGAGESIWASQVDRVSFVDFLARAWLGVVHFVWVNAVFWYAIFMTWALYTMLRSRSVSRTSPLLEKILDSWPRRGWHGLYNVAPMAIWMMAFVGLSIANDFDGLDLGLAIGCFAALGAIAGVHSERRVLAGLPIAPSRFVGVLHLASAAVAVVPLVMGTIICHRAWADLPTVIGFWLLGVSIGQLAIPYRMNQGGLPLPVRWGMYGIVLLWAGLVVVEVWPATRDVASSVATAYNVSWNTAAVGATFSGPWFPLTCIALFGVATVVAVHRTYMDLTRDAGVHHTGPAKSWRGKAA